MKCDTPGCTVCDETSEEYLARKGWDGPGVTPLGQVPARGPVKRVAEAEMDDAMEAPCEGCGWAADRCTCDVPDDRACPACGAVDLGVLGQLGRLTWYRCRDCGMDVAAPSDGAAKRV